MLQPIITDPVLLNLERRKKSLLSEIENLNKTKNNAFHENSIQISKLAVMKEELTKEVDELAQRRSLIEQANADSGEAVTSYKQSALQELDRELEGKRRRIADLHKRLEDEEKNLQGQIKAYQEKIEQVEQSRLVLEARTKKVEEREKALDESDKQQAQILSQAQNAVKTAENRKGELDKSVSELEIRKTNLETDLVALNKKYHQEREELDRRILEVKLKERQITDTMELHKQKTQELKNKEEYLRDWEQRLIRESKEKANG